MAGHKFSGYAASLWQALFASFIQLFTRVFPFTTTTEPTRKSEPQPKPQSPPQQAPTNPTPLTSKKPHSSSLCSSSTSPHHRFSSSSQERQLQHKSFIDLEQGLDYSSEDETMAPPKNRGGGRNRGGGYRGNASRSAASNTPSAGPSNGITEGSSINQSTAPPPASQGFDPARVTPARNQGNTSFNPFLTYGQQPTGAGRGSFNHTPSQFQPTSDRKENATLHSNAPRVKLPQSPALNPLVAENRAQPQHTGTRSPDTTMGIYLSKPELPENIRQRQQPEGLNAGMDSLAIDNTPSRVQSPEAKPATTTATPKAPSVVPVIVVLPLSTEKAAPKPAKPAPLSRTITPTPAPTPTSASTHTPLAPMNKVYLPGLVEPQTEEERVEREIHLKFMRDALDMSNLALSTNETPVGCVLVHNGKVIAKGMNATNHTRNGTRHAEFMAVCSLLSRVRSGEYQGLDDNSSPDTATSWGDVDPEDGHIFPYGQKLHPSPAVDKRILSECILYVTVEPCVMCASFLRQTGIKKVYFGAVNDKFGGTGGVFKIHQNSKPVAKPEDRPYQNGYGPQDTKQISKGKAGAPPRDEDDGDGGNVESGYPVEGGYLRDEAVSLLRRFYVQENGRAPQPRKKEGRAARLFAMENQAKNGGNDPELLDTVVGPVGPDAPADNEENAEDAGGPAAI
ncbi:cytidine deaminase-like protein [Jackrogersella minutella]|nr:cytidine deaminase-like protein [Jackrogersella minutella]